MAEPLLIIGSYLSPYVRKVLVLLELKGIAYRIDPIVPFASVRCARFRCWWTVTSSSTIPA